MMKAIFFTEGGRKFGFGHIVRCAGLYEAFEEKGVASEFVVNADHTVKGILKNIDYRICNWLKEQNKALSMIGKGDIVIIDSYVADVEFYGKVSRRAQKAVFLDDYQRIHYPEGTIINSAIYAADLRYPQGCKNMLLGTRYSSLRKEFWDIPERKKAGRTQRILITFGGMNYAGLIERVTRHFKKKLPWTLHGIDFAKRKGNSLNFLQSILDSDSCISGGGQTIYNLARCGLPTIGVCLADNQLLNLKRWDKTRFLKFIGSPKDRDFLAKLERFILGPHFSEFLKSGRIGQRYIDGQGARRVVQALLN